MKNHNLITPENYEEFYFIDPDDKEFKETIKNARKEIGNTSGSRYALQDKQE